MASDHCGPNEAVSQSGSLKQQPGGGDVAGVRVAAVLGGAEPRPEAGQAAAPRLPRAALLRVPSRRRTFQQRRPPLPPGDHRLASQTPACLEAAGLYSTCKRYRVIPEPERLLLSSPSSSCKNVVPHLYQIAYAKPPSQLNRCQPQLDQCQPPVAALQLGNADWKFLQALQNKLDSERDAVDLWLLGEHDQLVLRFSPPARYTEVWYRIVCKGSRWSLVGACCGTVAP